MVGPEFSEDIAQLKLDLEQQIEQDSRIIEILEKQRNFDDTIGAQMEQVTNSIQTLFNDAINSQASLDEVDAHDHERGNTLVEDSQTTTANILEKLKPFQDELQRIQSLQADNKTMLFNFIASQKDQEGFAQNEMDSINQDVKVSDLIDSIEAEFQNNESSNQTLTISQVDTNARVSRAFNPTKRNYLNIPLRNHSQKYQERSQPQVSEQSIQTENIIEQKLPIIVVETQDQIVQTDQVRYVLIKPPANIQQNNRRRVIHDPSTSPRQLQNLNEMHQQQQHQKQGLVVQFGGGVSTDQSVTSDVKKPKKMGVTVSSQASDGYNGETMVNSAVNQRVDEIESYEDINIPSSYQQEKNKHPQSTTVPNEQSYPDSQQQEQYEEYEYGDEGEEGQEMEVPWYQLMEPVKIVELADQCVQTMPQETQSAATQFEEHQQKSLTSMEFQQNQQEDQVPQISHSLQDGVQFDFKNSVHEFHVQEESQREVGLTQQEKGSTQQNKSQNNLIQSSVSLNNNILNVLQVESETKQIQTDFQPIRYTYRKKQQKNKGQQSSQTAESQVNDGELLSKEINLDQEFLLQENAPKSPKEDNNDSKSPIKEEQQLQDYNAPNMSEDGSKILKQDDDNDADYLIYIEDQGTQTDTQTSVYYDNDYTVQNEKQDQQQIIADQFIGAPQTCPHCNYQLYDQNRVQSSPYQDKSENFAITNKIEPQAEKPIEVGLKPDMYARQNERYQQEVLNSIDEDIRPQTQQPDFKRTMTGDEVLLFETPSVQRDSFNFDNYQNEFSSNVNDPISQLDQITDNQQQQNDEYDGSEQRESMAEPYDEDVDSSNEDENHIQQYNDDDGVLVQGEEHHNQRQLESPLYRRSNERSQVQQVAHDTQTDELPNLELALELYAKTMAEQASQEEDLNSGHHYAIQSPIKENENHIESEIRSSQDFDHQIDNGNKIVQNLNLKTFVDSETQYEQDQVCENLEQIQENQEDFINTLVQENMNPSEYDSNIYSQDEFGQQQVDNLYNPLGKQEPKSSFSSQKQVSEIGTNGLQIESTPNNQHKQNLVNEKVEQLGYSEAKRGVDQDVQTDDEKKIENFNFEIQQTFSTDDNRLIAMKIFTKHIADQYEFLAESSKAPGAPARLGQNVSLNSTGGVHQGHRPPRGGYSSQQPLNSLYKQGGQKAEDLEVAPKEIVEHYELSIDITEDHFDYGGSQANHVGASPLVNEEYQTELNFNPNISHNDQLTGMHNLSNQSVGGDNSHVQNQYNNTSENQIPGEFYQNRDYSNTRTSRDANEEGKSSFRASDGGGDQQYYQEQPDIGGYDQSDQYPVEADHQIGTYQQNYQMEPFQQQYSTDYQQYNQDQYDSSIYQHDYNKDLNRFEEATDETHPNQPTFVPYDDYGEYQANTIMDDQTEQQLPDYDQNNEAYTLEEEEQKQLSVSDRNQHTNEPYFGQHESYGAEDREQTTSHVPNDSSDQQELNEPEGRHSAGRDSRSISSIDQPLNTLHLYNKKSSYQENAHQQPHNNNEYQQNYLAQSQVSYNNIAGSSGAAIHENSQPDPIEMPQIGDEYSHQKPLMSSLQSHSLRASNPNEYEAIDDDENNSITSPNRTNVSSSHQSVQKTQQESSQSSQSKQQPAFRQKRTENHQRQQLQSQGPSQQNYESHASPQQQHPLDEFETELEINMEGDNTDFGHQQELIAQYTINQDRNSQSFVDNTYYDTQNPQINTRIQEFGSTQEHNKNQFQVKTENQNNQAEFDQYDNKGPYHNQSQHKPEMMDQDTQTDNQLDNSSDKQIEQTSQECQTIVMEYEEQSIQTINVSTDSIEVQTEATSNFATNTDEIEDMEGQASFLAQPKNSNTVELQTSFDTDDGLINQQNVTEIYQIKPNQLKNENQNDVTALQDMVQLEPEFSIVDIHVVGYAHSNSNQQEITQIFEPNDSSIQKLNNSGNEILQSQTDVNPKDQSRKVSMKEDEEELQDEGQALTKNQKKRKNKKNKAKKIMAMKSQDQVEEEGLNQDLLEPDNVNPQALVERSSQINIDDLISQHNTNDSGKQVIVQSENTSEIQSGIINIEIQPTTRNAVQNYSPLIDKDVSLSKQIDASDHNGNVDIDPDMVDQNLSAIEIPSEFREIKANNIGVEDVETQTEKDEPNEPLLQNRVVNINTQLVQTSPVQIMDDSDDETFTEIVQYNTNNQKPQLAEQETQTDGQTDLSSSAKVATGYRQKPGQIKESQRGAPGTKQAEFAAFQQPQSDEHILEFKDDQQQEYIISVQAEVDRKKVNLTGSEDIDLDFQSEIQEQHEAQQQQEYWNKVGTPEGKHQFGHELQDNPANINIQQNDYYGSKQRQDEGNDQVQQQLSQDDILKDIYDEAGQNNEVQQNFVAISNKANKGGLKIGVSPQRMPNSELGDGTSKGANDDEILTYTDQDHVQLDQEDLREKSPMQGLNRQFNIRKQQSRRERGLMSEVPQHFKTVGGTNAGNDSTASPYKHMYEKTPKNNNYQINQREFISEQMMSPETVSLDSSHLSSEEFKGNFHHPRLGGQLHKISSTNAGGLQQSSMKSPMSNTNNNFDDRLSSNQKEGGGESSTKNANVNKQFYLKQNTNVIDIQEDEDGLVTDETKSAEQGIDEQTQTDGVVLVTTQKELNQGATGSDIVILIDREEQAIQTDMPAAPVTMPAYQRQKSGFRYISLQKSRDAPLQQHSQRYRDINEEEEYKIQEALEGNNSSIQNSRSTKKKRPTGSANGGENDDDEVRMGDEQDQSHSVLLRDTILNRDLTQGNFNYERSRMSSKLTGALHSGDLIFVEGQELDVDIFMIKDFTLLASLSTDQNQMTCAICINGTIFIGCANSYIYAFTLKGFQRVKEVLTQQVCCCFLDYKGEAIFCGERKGVIEIIDVKEGSKTNGQKLKTFTLPNMKHIISLSKSVRDDELVLASESGIYFALVNHDEIDGYSIVLQDESYFEGQSIIAAIEYEPLMLVLCLENQNGEIDVYIIDRNKRQAVKKIEVSQCTEGGEGAIIMRLMPNFDIKSRPYLFIRDDQEITFIDLQLFEQYTVIISTNTEDPQQSYQLELRSKEDEEAIDYIVQLYNEGDCSEMKKIEFFTRLLFQ